jgi:hypothetical protein
LGNAEYNIALSDVKDGMKDGDNIQLAIAENKCDTDKVQLGFALGKNVSWWKGLILFNRKDNNTYQVLAEQAGDECQPVIVEIDKSILSEKDLVLSKAKTFGIHTNMYCIKDAATSMQGGNKYSFTWIKD